RVRLLALFLLSSTTATIELYTLSLHDALPISSSENRPGPTINSEVVIASSASGSSMLCIAAKKRWPPFSGSRCTASSCRWRCWRSEEHTSELQSRENLVCRLLLEKKKQET